MKILVSPDPVLRQVAEPVESGDKTMKRLAKQMAKEMYRSDGVGLAAPQVGVLKRMVVIDCDYVAEDEDGQPLGRNTLVLINPQIVDHSQQRIVHPEACLSVPGISVPVERWVSVKVRCYDENFEERFYEGDGLFGRCLQHELDHLDGVTLFEHLDGIARMEAIEEYEHLHEEGRR